MQRTEGIQRTMADVIAERKTQKLPGAGLHRGLRCARARRSAEFDVDITDSLTSSRRKPRYPSRNTLKVVDLSRDPRQYDRHEGPALPDDPKVNFADVRPEVANRTTSLQFPSCCPPRPGCGFRPDCWEDRKRPSSCLSTTGSIVRLGTAENHTIIRGDGGLLNMPKSGGYRQGPVHPRRSWPPGNEVEQVGCTADGLIINPADYYTFMGQGSLMNDLEQNRSPSYGPGWLTRAPRLSATSGRAQLFDAGRSVMRFANAATRDIRGAWHRADGRDLTNGS